MQVLFNNDHNKSILAKFRVKLDGIVTSTDFEQERNRIIELVISSMANHSEEWDSKCQINIGWIGAHFISKLSDEQLLWDKQHLDDLCAMCFRFLFELYLSMKNDLSMEFESAKRYIFQHLDLFDMRAKEQIEYAIREMPIAIFKEIVKSDGIANIRKFNETFTKAEKLKETWDKELDEREKKVDKLKESLESYENGFNFVGLYQGFDDLAIAKEREKNKLLFWLKILSFVIVLPILSELYIVYEHIRDITTIREGLLFSLLPTVSLIALSLYYFRILLFNYKSVKTQILQIELRKTLCRFIQNYADYSSTLKKGDPDALTKFENIIFAQIVSDDGKLPSTLDGIDQVTTLIKTLRS